MQALTFCKQELPTEYVKNWFGASGFFNTISTTGMLKGRYFITCDRFGTTDIWSLRYVNVESGQIDTIGEGMDTKSACQDVMADHIQRLKDANGQWLNARK